MAVVNLNFDKDVLPVVRARAQAKFAGDSDKPAKVADAVSEAWYLLQTAGENATPKSLAFYAVRRVKAGRQFSQSSRSLTGPNPRRVERSQQVEMATALIVRDSDNPAELAVLRIDFPEWFNTVLKQRQREVCEAMLQGDSTSELAERFGVTRGAISQTRRWLVENWLAYTA